MKKKRKWLRWVLIVLGVLVLVAAILFFPVKYHVEKSVVIAVPPAEVFAKVQDLREWPQWSPWLVLEPGVEIEYQGDTGAVGGSYSWSGEVIGSGTITHEVVEPEEALELALHFLEPFESNSEVGFRFEPVAGESPGVKVTWLLDGKIPRIMRPMMTAWIGMDYDRGLRMLKDLSETGKVATSTELEDGVDVAAFAYVGLTREFDFADVEAESGAAFEALAAALDGSGIATDQGFVSIYEEFDMVGQRVKMVAGVVVDSLPASLPEGLAAGEVPAHQAVRITHTGSMHLVGNAWSRGMQYLYGKGLKQSRSIMPYERFAADYDSQSADASVAEVYFPLK